MSALTESDTVNEFDLIFNTNVLHSLKSDTVIMNLNWYFNTNVCTPLNQTTVNEFETYIKYECLHSRNQNTVNEFELIF